MNNQNNLRIGFLIASNLNGGGAERVIANLSNQIIEEVQDVVIISCKRDEYDYYIKPSIKRYYYEDVVNKNTLRFLRVYNRIKYIRQICRMERLDVLIGFLPVAITYCVIATLGIKTKSIISERNDPNNVYPCLFDKFLCKVSFRLADFSVFQTSDAKSWFPKTVQLKSEIILNPVADVFYYTQWHPQKNLFVTCGRLVKQKNHRLLIEAFAISYKKCPDIKLKIYGEGPLYNEIQSHIKRLHMDEVITLCGKTNNTSEVLSYANFFILTSDYEGIPNALMEAMAMGIPSISTNCPCGGPKMLNIDNKQIELVPVGDINAMADAICRLVNNKEYSDSLSKESKKRAMAFTTNTIKNKWLGIINKLKNE